MGEDGKTIETGEKGGEESMSGEKAVPVALMKPASERRREDRDQRERHGLLGRGLGGGELVLKPWRDSGGWRG